MRSTNEVARSEMEDARSLPRKALSMKIGVRSYNPGTTILCIIPGVLLILTGCFSSRSLIESLAKTPHHRVQDSQGFSSLNSYQQDFLYLTEILKETHPEPYAAWSKGEFEAEQRRLLGSL